MKEKNDELEIEHKKQMINLKEQYNRECKEIQKKIYENKYNYPYNNYNYQIEYEKEKKRLLEKYNQLSKKLDTNYKEKQDKLKIRIKGN